MEEALAEWASTPQGRANPPEGDTVEEQFESLMEMLATLTNPSAVEAAAFPERSASTSGGGNKQPG